MQILLCKHNLRYIACLVRRKWSHLANHGMTLTSLFWKVAVRFITNIAYYYTKIFITKITNLKIFYINLKILWRLKNNDLSKICYISNVSYNWRWRLFLCNSQKGPFDNCYYKTPSSMTPVGVALSFFFPLFHHYRTFHLKFLCTYRHLCALPIVINFPVGFLSL